MTDYSYEAVCVTTRDYGTEWMVVRTDNFSSAQHVTPNNFFKTKEEAETFIKEIDNGR